MKRAALIGNPVSHSRSPDIYHYWFQQHHMQGCYDRFAVQEQDIRPLFSSLRQKGYAGLNVTIPHKSFVYGLMDAVSLAARRMAAVNLVMLRHDETFFGDNTDGEGFRHALDDARTSWQTDLGTDAVVLLGAGGAARAIAWALSDALDQKHEIRIVNRSEDKGYKLATEIPTGTFYPLTDLRNALTGCGLLINSTAIGMKGKQLWSHLGIDWQRLFQSMQKTIMVCDIVYVPLETELATAARCCDLHFVDGLGMLLHQARLSFCALFGILPTIDAHLYHMVQRDIMAE